MMGSLIMNNFDIPNNITLTNENSKGSISYLIDVYQDPQNLGVTGFIKMHAHPEIQFCYVTKGCVEFIVENERYSVQKGEVVYINSSCVHMSRAQEPGSTYVCFNIKPEFLFPFLAGIDSHQYVHCFLNESNIKSLYIRENEVWQCEVISLLKLIYRLYMEEEFGYEMRIASCVIQLWYTMISGNKEKVLNQSAEESPSQMRIKQAIQYIELNYNREIELQDISNVLGIGNEEVCRLFKKTLNITCFDYIGNYRIMKSMDMLTYTNEAISEIALKCGFNSFSYYTKYFKKKVGCSPSQYRKQTKK